LLPSIVGARHDLIYRPFLLARGQNYYWKDCPFLDFLKALPTAAQAEDLYSNFGEAVVEAYKLEREEQRQMLAAIAASGTLPTATNSTPKFRVTHS
jgi:hypothetical protein